MSLGALFTTDFLTEGLPLSPIWDGPGAPDATALATTFRAILAGAGSLADLNEAQTEERVVRPMLRALGWDGLFEVQSNIETRGRANVADYAYFPDAQGRARADAARAADAKLAHAIAIGDAKAWKVDFEDANTGSRPGETAVAQTLRYLERAKIQSNRAVRWAILSNGRVWRLYFADAKSLLDGYFEADLAEILALPGAQPRLAPHTGEDDSARRARQFKTFALAFRPQAFRPDPDLDNRSFHEFALAEGARWEAKVRTDLSRVVFAEVFPGLIRGLAAADPQEPTALTPAYLNALREAALTVLYRLLFALYAEDRDLLPSHDRDYDAYSLSKVRDAIAARRDAAGEPSDRRTEWWDHCAGLFRTIDEGDDSIGVPPYNGGLFARDRSPLAQRTRLSDRVFSPLLDKLSRTEKDGRLVRINFRDLSVRELGAIYEGLLEFEPVAQAGAPGGIEVRPNPFSRKSSGSYYTPDELVSLIIARTVGPLVEERLEAFRRAAKPVPGRKLSAAERASAVEAADPASRILDLKICDPAMGSGHFLVSLIDYLALRVVKAIGEAADLAGAGYVSPLLARLAAVRERIRAEAARNRWTVREAQLTDQNLIKRMVLKRCVYGVDKNPMAVELAKVALWLHTFTAGAPLSFLDHHLRCGDSLFGERVRAALDELREHSGMFINDAIRRAEGAVAGMEFVENRTDAEIAEVKASASAFADVETATGPLQNVLDLLQAAKWALPPPARGRARPPPERAAWDGVLGGSFGDPFDILSGASEPQGRGADARNAGQARALLAELRALAAQERFLHWEVAFPGVWRNWQSAAPEGGFDAVIGNPPWDRMKMQEVEWFAARAPTIARQARAADRKRMIEALKQAGDPLAASYGLASGRAETAMERARQSGDYPLLSRGDINLYSLFVERAQALIKPTGIAGLLTPSGIASDLTASAFFKGVAAAGRVMCLFDFENRRGAFVGAVADRALAADALAVAAGADRGRRETSDIAEVEATRSATASTERRESFFPDVNSRFKFCAFVVGGNKRIAQAADCAFFLRDPPEKADPDKLFRMTAADFALVNPNTGTAPIFRTRRDAELTTAIYRRLPVLVDRSSGAEVKAWPVKYLRMFDMTNDSYLFWTRERLERHGAYPVELGRWRKGEEEWVPLYVGRMIHQFDNRAASVTVNEENLHNAALSEGTSDSEHADPRFVPGAQYWVKTEDIHEGGEWTFSFRDIARSTDERSAIGSIIPTLAAGNTLPLVTGLPTESVGKFAANFASFCFDFVCRQKNQSTHLNWYILEQLPVIPPAAYSRAFGPKTAAEIVRDHVLRLTYTAFDMRPFARDMGYEGEPFRWDEGERRHLRARLDALYFHLYGIESEDDIRYILSTFPIVERKDRAAHDGVYLTAELIFWYFRALAAGDPDTHAPETTLIRNARGR